MSKSLRDTAPKRKPSTPSKKRTATKSASKSSTKSARPWESPEWEEAVRQTPGLKPFFDNLESFLELPEGVAKLRTLLMELAIRGKLQTNSEDDEPASELLLQIKETRTELAEREHWRKDKPLDPIASEEILYEIPRNWCWVRAAELCYPISSGTTPKKQFFTKEGIPYLKVYNIRDQKVDFDYKPQFIDREHHETKMKRCHLFPGMVLLNIVGPPLGKTAVVTDQYPVWNCNQAISFFRLVGETLPEYLHVFFKAGTFLRNIALIGTAGQDNISVTKCKNIVVALPPLAEQRRIVSKVEGLMSLCDTLEDARRARDSVRERASRSVLASLTSAPRSLEDRERQGASRRSSSIDPDSKQPTASAMSLTKKPSSAAEPFTQPTAESNQPQDVSPGSEQSRNPTATSAVPQNSTSETLASSWQRLSDHFEILLAQPETVPHLRQSILQLAVQGKLVPQDPSDEPASKMRESLAKSRRAAWEELEFAKLCARNKKPKGDKWKTRLKDVGRLDSRQLGTLPCGWSWVPVEEAGAVQLGRQRAPKYATGPNMTPYLRVQNVFEDRICTADVKEMQFDEADTVTFKLRRNDILLNEGQSTKLVGRPAIYRDEVPGACFQNTLVRFRHYEGIVPEYALLVFRHYMRGRFQEICQQTTNIAHLGASRFAALEFPLAPKAEQKRIVSKVSVLLSQCDELSARLRSRQSTTDALLTALIHQILESQSSPNGGRV